MKQPWLKFFPADWRGDLTLGPCSLAARGLWMEMLCIMSDATQRGSLVKDGVPYTTKRLAAVARAPVKEVEKLLAELEAEGVFSRDPDGTIFSRRMRRDTTKAEKDRANGGLGGNPYLKQKDNGGVNPSDNGEDKAQKLEARSQNPEARSSLRSDAGGDLPSAVKRFFEVYPKDDEFDGVTRELDRRLADGADLDDIVAGARRYAAEVAGKPPDMIRSPVKWLRNGSWKTGKPKSEASKVPTIRVDRDTPAGQAWGRYIHDRTGNPVKWILTCGPNGPGRHFATEWPPSSEENAA